MIKSNSQEAKDLWYSINDYFIMADDPGYEKLKGFAKKIQAVKDSDDREALIRYFEMESGNKIGYFK